MGSCISTKPKKLSSHQKDLKFQKLNFLIENEDSFLKSYSVIQKIGEGATSNVKSIVCKQTNISRAVKSISLKTEKTLTKALKEIEILKAVDHPSIIKSIETFTENKIVHIVSELYTGKTLLEVLNDTNGLTELTACKNMYLIASGLYYLHNLGLMHRDIKPENIMFESNENNSLLKIIDLGSAKYVNKEKRSRKRRGTILYMSPQVIDGSYTEKCDV